jgi:SAM-dependent methyltransferase
MDYYTRHAEALFARYDSLPPEQVHRCWLDLLPHQAGLACDIGAGSGRDARWLAAQGWDVTAVEPNAALRTLAQASPTPTRGSVTWLDDSLPELQRLRALDIRFQLILISAVWMHLTPTQHARAMRIVSDLLAPGGLLVVTLRKGPDAEGRFHPISTDALIQHARDRALMLARECRDQADVTRGEVGWDCVVLCKEKGQPAR